MSDEGKYVRVYHFSEDEEDEDQEAGRYVRAPVLSNEECGYDIDEGNYRYEATAEINKENELLKEQLAKMKRTVEEITSRNNRSRDRDVVRNDAEESWTCSRSYPSSQPLENTPNIRWDQMKPFPKNIPANKMWEEWTKYIENFEIAALLSNAVDPVRRSQLLFLSMGEEMQGIVRAAKLRPNLHDSDCYALFVKNIEHHLRSMTDTAAEHEAFSCMQQERGETVVNYHARVMEKVRLCRYSPSDQERFVRAQLLKGMSNRELAKTARTFGHETNFIVQSATRDESYRAEPAQAGTTYDSVLNQVFNRAPFRASMKRYGSYGKFSEPRNKQGRFENRTVNSRQEYCPRCNKWMHKNRPCPALKLKCHECGTFGHFAVVCRKKRVYAVDDVGPQEPKMEPKEEQVK
ncbi:uncharacterized protein LOC134288930 [Aedes albopictus]|uniref:CCHC-type domain-containing protein n=1 Tax=Aedes albopictus TaxID=7160 RepID=A0ABM2A2F1_AEDAL